MLAKTKRKLKNKFKSLKESATDGCLEQEEEEEPKNMADENDGRLSSYRPRKDSIDFLGKEIDKRALIRWRKYRPARVKRQSLDVTAVDVSISSIKSKGLDTTRA